MNSDSLNIVAGIDSVQGVRCANVQVLVPATLVDAVFFQFEPAPPPVIPPGAYTITLTATGSAVGSQRGNDAVYVSSEIMNLSLLTLGFPRC